ncbi:MAG: tripartite tricarboxylate transporter substrate binding protein BugD [Xanthobacteraceae bacterium]|nr:tripartite tricarboxylate transporter substrate binding protein BugD [Xanthobacteraceae bacterium]
MVNKLSSAVFGALIILTADASAQTFPNKAVTMIIPFAAGGPTDVLGRIVGIRMAEILGQQVVIENVGGAGGMTGSRRGADAAPDGYTMVLGTVGTHAQGQTLYKKPLYDAVADFTPVALLAEVPIVLITRKELPANNFKEFVAYAKANQAKMQYGSAGVGAASHLGCVLLDYVMGTKITHVPYRGTGPATQDLLAGRIDFLCQAITAAKAQIDAGTVRAPALLDAVRSPALPNVPTALEQGVKGLEAYTWNALFLPKNAPPAVVKTLNAAAVRALKTPEVRDRLQSLGAQIVADDRTSPEYLAKFVKSEIEKWAAPIKASGVVAD